MNDILLKSYIEKGRLYVRQHEFYAGMMAWSGPTYFKMRALGLTPKETRFPGAVVRISIAEIDRWMKARDNPTGDEAAMVAEAAAKLKERSQHATSGGRA